MKDLILFGDCLDTLKQFDEKPRCCITSPPYYGLRDYGTAQWENGDINCDHIDPQQNRGKDSAKQSTNNKGQGTSTWKICKKCGASIFYKVNKSKNICIAAGMFNNPTKLKTTANIFVKGKLDYYRLDSKLPKFNQNSR